MILHTHEEISKNITNKLLTMEGSKWALINNVMYLTHSKKHRPLYIYVCITNITVYYGYTIEVGSNPPDCVLKTLKYSHHFRIGEVDLRDPELLEIIQQHIITMGYYTL